jgi:hypothetical protein
MTFAVRSPWSRHGILVIFHLDREAPGHRSVPKPSNAEPVIRERTGERLAATG